MNRIIYFFLIVIVCGCQDVLDQSPTNMISEDIVKKDKVLMDALISQLYSQVQWQITSGQAGTNQGLIPAMGGILRAYGDGQGPAAFPLKIIDEKGSGPLDYWPYEDIRSANEILILLDQSVYEDEYILQRKSEVRFLRAWMYFQMVIRYGGVPLITTPQSLDQNPEELFVKRDSEKAVYDFIKDEMDDLALDLPDQYSAKDYGRPTCYAALALKSRAMLYAASIANFGKQDLEGLLGFPKSEAEYYYNESLNASKLIMSKEVFSLYKKTDNPIENYSKLFIDKDNPEVIFAELYDIAAEKTHCWSYLNIPDGFQKGWGSNFHIFLEFLENYEKEDGSKWNLDRKKMNSNTLWNLDTVFRDMEPRFQATVFYPECEFQGKKVYFHTNTIGKITDPEWPKVAPKRNFARSGFMVRKRVDESVVSPDQAIDDENFIIFRYAEILLNYAEAAFYLNKSDLALPVLNEVRIRAGLPKRNEITEDFIRHERTIELAIEDHRYFDLRRWRIAEDVLNNVRYQGIDFTYNFDEGAYIFKLKNAEKQARFFQERHYYLPISRNRIEDNGNLIENPGYSQISE